ncbi:MAG: methionine adenosyltransferase [Polyangiales bacterium]
MKHTAHRVRVERLPAEKAEVEIVERKGLAHPDTICDAVAERASAALSRHYLEHFGTVLHHNVDKALLVGGASRPRFAGGEIVAPVEIHLAGRAVRTFEGKTIPVDDIVIAEAYEYLRSELAALDLGLQVKVLAFVREGSADLDALDATRIRTGVVRANDTSCGVGHAPLSPVERAVLQVDERLRLVSTDAETAFVGQDLKVLAVRDGDRVDLTIACAIVDRFVPDLDAYLEAKRVIANLARAAAGDLPGSLDVTVNAADDVERGEVYLTVTGTSAEAGDDGEVGRGNRANGLITPLRPQSLEATAGKNPHSHVGKLYNVLAREIAEAIVGAMPEIAEAHVVLVSRIGAPIDEPQLAAVRIAPKAGGDVGRYTEEVSRIAQAHFAKLPELTMRIVRGEVTLF